MMTEDVSDRQFAERALAWLPATTPSPGLEAALLAAYDAWQEERAKGPWAGLKAGLTRFSRTIWPGAPVWAPMAAFAASLMVGAMLGAALPAASDLEPPGFSLEHTQSFSLLSPDPVQEDL
jgi:hypothetical protein